MKNRLNEVDLEGIVAKKKSPLSAKHQKDRLNFAKKHQSWCVDDWKQVLFSDESKINKKGSDGVIWTWKKRGSCETNF